MTQTPMTHRNTLLQLGFAVLVLIAVVAIAYAFVRSEPGTELEVVAATTTTTSTVPDEVNIGETGTGSLVDIETQGDVPPVNGDRTDEDGGDFDGFGDAAAESFFAGDGRLVVHSPDGFGALAWTSDGIVARRSANAVVWKETSTSGLPDNGNPRGLTLAGDRFIVLFEEWPSYPEGEEPFFFDGVEMPELQLAISPDLLSWELSPLPSIETNYEYGASVSTAGFAATDSRVAALMSVYPFPPNEHRILFDAGVLTEAELRSYCGLSWESFDTNEPVVIYTCDYSAEERVFEEFEARMQKAETEEERLAIELEYETSWAEPGKTEIATIEPGTPLYNELVAAYRSEEQLDVTSLVISGPIGGPYTITELHVPGNPGAIVAADGRFVAVFSDYERSQAWILRSSDGQNWDPPISLDIGVEEGIYDIDASDSLIVATGNDRNGTALVLTSTDAGVTWVRQTFGDGLYESWSYAVSGPAGVALWVDGSTEPYPEFALPDLSMENDGYTLTMKFGEDRLVLTGPDGATIYDLDSLTAAMDGQLPEIARQEGESVVIFSDPNSGDDLVSFSEQDFEEAYRETEPFEPDEFVEPLRARELWFSGDGSSWTKLAFDPPAESENSYATLAAVGDDEVLVSLTTWFEPPARLMVFEEEGRDPTDAEIAELDSWFAENDGGTQIEWIRIEVG